MSSQEPPQAPAPEKVDEAFKESNRKFDAAYKDCKKEWFERRKEERKKNGAWW
ncbi:hypothetical protein CTRI78_v002196 [Colletotrichum trifolii]|uniref:Uncharacterized protein n=1 Tax=Colletotrichum trifolii TaxID=5466 RepID=A0A4R8RQR9_COLTR|nr:hypothetical protein CTRI78_v002196 [Colletotrichum trifolii]